MHTARPVGLSQDGRSLIVTTPGGEELAVPVDDRFHAALRGDQPRLGQLEIEMENALSPRDIQARIRAGQSLEEVSRVAGLPLDRVERFAAPVLAERDHVALLAMSSSVRRRGETSGHRLLQAAVGERLGRRGVDLATVDWSSFRMEDGRWSVSARYRSGESLHEAVFAFDLRARFSVPANDEARWAVGEQSSLKGPQPGRRRPTGPDGDVEGADAEPTLDLSDELALIRAIQPDPPTREPGHEDAPATEPGTDRTPDGPDGADQDEPGPADEPAQTAGAEVPGSEESQGGRVATVRTLYPVADRAHDPDRSAQQPAHDETSSAEVDHDGPLGTTAGATGRGGTSDASAVPVTGNGGWEPGIVVDYPVEPSPEPPEDADTADQAGRRPGGAGEDEAARRPAVTWTSDTPPDGPVSHTGVFTDPRDVRSRTDAEQQLDRSAEGDVDRMTEVPAPADPIVEGEDRREEAEELEKEQAARVKPDPAPTPPAADPPARDTPAPESPAPAAATPKAPGGKRKRAAVPSWDEIMFGGPPRSS